MDKVLDGLHVLLVDDSRFTLRVMRGLVYTLGARQITESTNAADALKEIERSLPDIVLADWEMAPADGRVLLRCIRSHQSPAVRRLPVIIVSAHSDTNRVNEALAAGASGYLVKPVSRSAVRDRVIAALGKPSGKQSPTAAPQAGAHAPAASSGNPAAATTSPNPTARPMPSITDAPSRTTKSVAAALGRWPGILRSFASNLCGARKTARPRTWIEPKLPNW